MTRAAFLSLLFPGLGQIYNGERSKGISLVVVALGMIFSAFLFHSATTYILMACTYVAALVPAVLDAQRVARGVRSPFAGDAEWYVVVMLFAVGPFALPLLWQSKRFSKIGKIVWTALVLVVALVGVLIIASLGPIVDEMTKGLVGYQP